jgi:predicted glycoside hydrolase/deacetylase ChbG (UPF0249 family)
MTSRTLTPFVLCADDYGLTPEVSSGILDLAAQRRISATSVMSLSPDWPEWSLPLKAARTGLDIGLHLDLTSTFAKKDGCGDSLSAWMIKSTCRMLRPTVLERVIEKQLDLFEHHLGAVPDHVDGHQHIHQFPVIRDVLMRVLSRRYPTGQRPWLRISRSSNPTADFKARVIAAMGAKALERLAIHHGFAHSLNLSGIYDFQGNALIYHERLRAWLEELPQGSVLMCHPAKGINPQSPTPMASAWEYEVLASETLPVLLKSTLTEISKGQMLFGK